MYEVSKDKIKSKIMALEVREAGMISYAKLKIEERDWHAVQDSASDLRDIETEIKTLKNFIALMASE